LRERERKGVRVNVDAVQEGTRENQYQKWSESGFGILKKTMKW